MWYGDKDTMKFDEDIREYSNKMYFNISLEVSNMQMSDTIDF
jgi:hypothetical protein